MDEANRKHLTWLGVPATIIEEISAKAEKEWTEFKKKFRERIGQEFDPRIWNWSSRHVWLTPEHDDQVFSVWCYGHRIASTLWSRVRSWEEFVIGACAAHGRVITPEER